MPLMAFSLRIQTSARIQLMAVAACTAGIVAAPNARADTVSVAEMIRGINKTQAQCAATPQTTWVTANGRNFCMRYYLAPSGAGESRPVVFLQGDRLGVLNLRTGAFAVPEGEKDINTDDLMRVAVSLSKQTRNIAIYLGRVGLEGSSGDHRFRHSVLELNVTNSALDAIKKKYNFEGFHLIGQSGGAHLVAGMLSLRNDIGCAVIGSGPLSPSRRTGHWDDPALEHFNPSNNTAAILRNRAARIMVVTDLADKKVSAEKQTNFVKALQQSGRPVEHYIVQAIDDNRHGVVAYSRLALAGCLKNINQEEIAKEVDKLVQIRVAAKSKNEKRNDANKDNAATSNEAQGNPNASDTARRQPLENVQR